VCQSVSPPRCWLGAGGRASLANRDAEAGSPPFARFRHAFWISPEEFLLPRLWLCSLSVAEEEEEKEEEGEEEEEEKKEEEVEESAG